MFLSNFGYANAANNTPNTSNSNNNNNNMSNPSSPTRGSLWGSACSPFKTTNVPIQNITMDHTIPIVNSVIAKSPGKTSPDGAGMNGANGIIGPGRTMKDYEDQLGSLKKENFNLKLRIYFLEERMGITSANEDAIQKNIELKVENESLKKELVEKQELLSQAAKAIKLIEDQKQESALSQIEFESALNQERERGDRLEIELEDYKAKLTNTKYLEQTFGVDPDTALENIEKLKKLEEIKNSLEIELKQLSASLEEERNWAQELENERDELKKRFESEAVTKEKLALKRDRDIEALNEKIKELEDQVFNKENSLQQLKKEIVEKDKVITEKNFLLDEKCKAFEEVTAVAEKRKKQIDQMRLSIKSRDDAITELNNKNRSLLIQYENSPSRRPSPPISPSVTLEESQAFRKSFGIGTPPKSYSSSLDLEPSIERSRYESQICLMNSRRDLEEKEREIKKQEEINKQLAIELYNIQLNMQSADQKYKKLELDHKKALQMIQEFMKRHNQLEEKQAKKDRKIMELEVELSRVRSEHSKMSRSICGSSVRRKLSNDLNNSPERDNEQQQFEEMEDQMNELKDEIEAVKNEKDLLQKQIQIETEELLDRLQDKELKIGFLECEKDNIKDELQCKTEELDKLKEAYNRINKIPALENNAAFENIQEELAIKNLELEEKAQLVERLTKELHTKTLNLQQLVNTELWSKNKEIAKLHNNMTMTQYQEKNLIKSIEENASFQLNVLIKELNDIGIQVSFTNDIIQLNYINLEKPVDATTMTQYIQKLITQKNELEKEVDYLKWLKIVSKPSNSVEIDVNDPACEKDKRYCELLRTHLKELVKFMKEMLNNTDQSADVTCDKQKKIILDTLKSSKILSDDFLHALEEVSSNKIDGIVRKSKSENFINHRNFMSTPSDSETFSEPDRVVSFARIGLTDSKQKSGNRLKSSKITETFTDSEESLDNISHQSYHSDLSDFDTSRQILELKDINSFLYSELNLLRNELNKNVFDAVINAKFSILLSKLEKSRNYCEKLQNSLERKIHECHVLKKESKQNSARKVQLEKKMLEQKTELLQYKDSADKKSTDLLITLNKENELLKIKIKSLEDENEEAKLMIARLNKDLDHLKLTHSQILVENTKLTNIKMRLEQKLRKSDSRYELTVRTLQDKFHKEVADLNQINESHRARVQELEVTNKELRRHFVACEASDSAPSSSGVSSIPSEIAIKQSCDNLPEYQPLNGCWLPITYPSSSGRSKSSCSPDLGIESDAAMTSTRPLQDTLKIAESMTDLLSDEDNNNPGLRDTDGDSPLPIEGGLLYYSLDEVQALKQENVALKRRLTKTRRALEDTFQHLSASNKNKKNVEKAITHQLMITKSILKKTRNYEEPEIEN